MLYGLLFLDNMNNWQYDDMDIYYVNIYVAIQLTVQ